MRLIIRRVPLVARPYRSPITTGVSLNPSRPDPQENPVSYQQLIRDPYISVTDENIALELGDGQNWRLMGFLYYREDSHGFDWKAHPGFFSSMTCFLPAADQVRLAKKHGLPPP
jgi:hypothetical protein